MLHPARLRFHPRSQQDRDRDRREAAMRAQVADLTARIHALEQEQHTQLKRIAQLQVQLDQAVTLINSLKR